MGAVPDLFPPNKWLTDPSSETIHNLRMQEELLCICLQINQVTITILILLRKKYAIKKIEYKISLLTTYSNLFKINFEREVSYCNTIYSTA